MQSQKKMKYPTAMLVLNLGVAFAYTVLGLIQFMQGPAPLWTTVVVIAIFVALGVILFGLFFMKSKRVECKDERAQHNMMRANSASFTAIMLAVVLYSTVGRAFGLRFEFSWAVVYFIVAAMFLVPTLLFLLFEKTGA